MFEPWPGAARADVDGRRAKRHVEELVRFHRIQASPGYDEAAAWLESRLAAIGVAHERIEVPADGTSRFRGAVMPEGWWCEHATADLVSAAGRERIADWGAAKLSLVQRSAPATGRFRIVDAGDGISDDALAGLDLRGAVALVSGSADRAHRRAVVGEGAAGLLCSGRRLMPPVRTDAHDRDSLAYTSFWWQADEPRGWGFVVSPARAQAVRERLARGETLELDVRIESRRFATRIPLISAWIPGELPGEVLLTAHLCHPQPSANDNGSGVAAALECAEVLERWRREGRWPVRARTVRVLWMPELTGTFAWIGSDPTRAERTVAALNLDMVGQDQGACGSTLLVEHPPHFLGSFAEEVVLRARDAAQDWVESFSGPGHFSLARLAQVPYSGGSDHTVWIDPDVGVPCPMLIQWPDRYYHSSLDTPERTDPSSLALASRTALVYAATIATADAQGLGRILALAGRGARRRLLGALDSDHSRDAAEAELARGRMALASTARLLQGLPPTDPSVPALARALPLALDELEGYYESEIAPVLSEPKRVPGGDVRVPVRRPGGALEMLRHLLPGWAQAPEAVRAAWRLLDQAPGATALDVAWYAADARRTVADIERCVELECGPTPQGAIGRFFECARALGLAAWQGE